MGFDKNWETIFSNQSWGKYPSEEIIRFIARAYFSISNRKEVSILDLGCGGGANTWFLAREGFDTFGIDGSLSAIKQASYLLKKDNLQAELIVGDFTKLDYDDLLFDTVLDSSAVQHNTWKNILAIHSEIHRVLKPNGFFWGRMINIETSAMETGKEVEKNTFSNIEDGLASSIALTHRFSLEEVNILMKKYVNVKVDRMFHTADNGQHSMGHYIALGQKQ
jgi:ubiquinone/menaquinone biosynthesis C-methylase UbiE